VVEFLYSQKNLIPMETEFLRTPNLGIEFFQGGVRCPIFLADKGIGRFRVQMSLKPFELRFPRLEGLTAVQICASLDEAIFNPEQYLIESIDSKTRRYFYPGTGIADALFSSSSLYINPEAHNYLDLDGRLLSEGNFGRIIFRNFFEKGEEHSFFDGLKVYLAIGLKTSSLYSNKIEEVILEFTSDSFENPFSKIVPSSSLKSIKIFIASSNELEEERGLLENFIGRKNKLLIKRNIFLESVIWEDFKDSISLTRKQDDYNHALLEADIVLSLFFIKVGKFTIEEFNLAYQQFLKYKKPLIYTYFKKGHVDIDAVSSSELRAKEQFLNHLKSIEHFPSFFTSGDDLLLKFGKQIDLYLLDNKLM
jgi:hypothetical protein